MREPPESNIQSPDVREPQQCTDSLRQGGNALFPNPPYIHEAQLFYGVRIVVDPVQHEFSVKPDFIVPNLLRVDRFLMQKLGNRFCGFHARPSCTEIDNASRGELSRQRASGF